MIEERCLSDIKVENMENETIGFIAEFECGPVTLHFYNMNVLLNHNHPPFLFVAYKNGKVQRVKFISQKSKSVFYIDPDTRNSIVHYCCYWGVPEALKKVLVLQTDIHLTRKN